MQAGSRLKGELPVAIGSGYPVNFCRVSARRVLLDGVQFTVTGYKDTEILERLVQASARLKGEFLVTIGST